MTESEDSSFERLLQFLQQQRGFDFTAYKRPSLMRRVARRMQLAGVDGFDSYTDYLEVHPEEYAQLFNTILINVTSFFRDGAPWEYLKEQVLPGLRGASSLPAPATSSSAPTCVARSSSGATTSCRIRRSRAWICSCAAIRSCISTPRRSRKSSNAFISP